MSTRSIVALLLTAILALGVNIASAFVTGGGLQTSGTIYFASGTVFDFGAGNMTLTHAAGTLTLAGGQLIVPLGSIGSPAIAGVGTSTGFVFATDLLTLGTGGGTRLTMSSGAINAFVAIQPNSNGSVALGAGATGFKGLYLDYTNTGTVGNVTINKPSGRVNIAAGGTSVVVTNNLVTAASHVVAWMSQADGTAGVTSVVPAAGSFTITTAAVTNQTSFDFLVINAD